MSSLQRSTTKTTRFWIAVGILLTKGYFKKHPKMGYRVDVYHDNVEIQQLLLEAFGGKVSRGKFGKGYWYISGEEKVRAFVKKMEPFITKSQWRHWLVSTGKISKDVCSGCGAYSHESHNPECYLNAHPE